MRVLAISGSLRSGSHNRELLRLAAAAAPAGVEVELYDGLKLVPPYDADDDVDPRPAAVTELKDAIADADAVLFATPEYNSSIPGALKNALDWVSRPLLGSPLRNKPVAVLSSSTGMFGAVWAQAELKKVLGAIGARVLDEAVTVPKAHERLAAGGDEALEDELATLVEALAVAVEERVAAAA
jgi:chromate reductase